MCGIYSQGIVVEETDKKKKKGIDSIANIEPRFFSPPAL